jgi:hypothetical protein
MILQVGYDMSVSHLFRVSVSILERRCSMRGGECTLKTRCGRQLDDHAEDCSQNEACCILVE